MDNIEKWACWSGDEGTDAGKTLMRLNLGWFRSISIICALIYIGFYAQWRLAGGQSATG